MHVHLLSDTQRVSRSEKSIIKTQSKPSRPDSGAKHTHDDRSFTNSFSTMHAQGTLADKLDEPCCTEADI
jgi:hypothetical protein